MLLKIKYLTRVQITRECIVKNVRKLYLHITTIHCRLKNIITIDRFFFFFLQGNMHPSFPYESSRSRGAEYGSGVGGVRGRGDVLVQSHPGLEDSLVLHNALSSVVEEAQASFEQFFSLCADTVACLKHLYSYNNNYYLEIACRVVGRRKGCATRTTGVRA